jgi:hypothetical protein
MCLQLVLFHLPIRDGITIFQQDLLVWLSQTLIRLSSTLIRGQANAFALAMLHS